ncbi:MAG: Fructose-2,6-bisphosphatase [Synergistales bacterium 58_81]|nr:MAG: Fructose-2,6-bisphosphatase [Synergistales bacterium 58_81]
MKRIFLVRHGETDWNLEGRFQGKMDIPLNILGKKQAEAASGALGTSSSPEKAAMPGGESLHDVSDRAWKAFREVLAGPGDVVAVFSHDAVIKVILCRILGCPLSSFWRFRIANGSITLIEDGGKGLSVSVMGDSCHLGSLWMRKEQKGL